jgi:AraC family transcriptional regulator
VPPGYSPVPARGEFGLRQASAGGFAFSEARYPPGLRIGRHAHERPLVTVVLGGGFEENGPGRADSCAPGSLILRPAGAPHADAVGRSGSHNLEIELDTGRLATSRSLARFADEPWCSPDPRLSRLGHEIQAELGDEDDDVRPLALEGLALELLAACARERRRPDRDGSGWLRRAEERLRASFREPPGLEALAAEAGVHPVNFVRAFRARFGAPPGDYVRGLKVEWAARVLASTARPLAEIALAAGFADQSHFTRVFRRRTGVTPARYRRDRRGRTSDEVAGAAPGRHDDEGEKT